jgi:DNA-binding response OmpR family regulator
VATGETAHRVLVVEDEPNIRDLILLHLQLAGWAATGVGNGEDALHRLRQEAFDLVVLDLMLPGLDGMTVLGAIRRESLNGDVPVLILTARREEADKVLGLESGADDYLTKPFSVRELVARAKALVRRPRASTVGSGVDATAHLRQGFGGQARPVQLHGVALDPARRRVTVDGAPVEVTSLEFDLLYLLASHPGIVFSREALLSRVWKGDTFVTERNVDSLIKRLRRRVERDPSQPRLILTVWGSGYKAADV